MPYDYTLTTVIPASAREIYDAWLDSLAHSELTGGRAMMSGESGAEFSAWDGYITGAILSSCRECASCSPGVRASSEKIMRTR